MKSQDLAKLKIPAKPGVYFFLGSPKFTNEGDFDVSNNPVIPGPEQSGFRIKSGMTQTLQRILYIGKATSLRDRVKSYFGKDLIETRGPLLVDMVFKSSGIKWQETDSVIEALILEASLIKKHQPYYNTREKDDKSWNYVCITKEPIPKVLVIRGKEINFESLSTFHFKLSTIFGPFTQGAQLREAMKIIRRIFPYMDGQSSKRDNYEFYRQIGLVPDVGTRAVIPALRPSVALSVGGKAGILKKKSFMVPINEEALRAYKKNIKHLKLFFEGKKKVIIRSLEKEMTKLAKAHKFEQAGKIRNQLFALKHINDIALLKNDSLQPGTSNLQPSYRIEAYDIAHMSGKNMVGVMTVVENEEAKKSEYRKFIIRTQEGSNDTGALEEVISRRLRHTEWGIPDLIVVDGGVAQKSVAEKVLKRYQFEIPVVSVVKDDRHKAREILGEKKYWQGKERQILLANSESHRFAITFHKLKRGKNFLI